MENGHSHTDVFGVAELIALLGGAFGPKFFEFLKAKTRFGGAVETAVHAVQAQAQISEKGHIDEALWGHALEQLAKRDNGPAKVDALTELLVTLGSHHPFEATSLRLATVNMKKQTHASKKAPPSKDGGQASETVTTSSDETPVVDFMDFCAEAVIRLGSGEKAREFLLAHQLVKGHWTQKALATWRSANELVARHTGLDGEPDERGIADELGDMLMRFAASLPDPDNQVPVKMGPIGRFVHLHTGGQKPPKVFQDDGLVINPLLRFLGLKR